MSKEKYLFKSNNFKSVFARLKALTSGILCLTDWWNWLDYHHIIEVNKTNKACELLKHSSLLSKTDFW